MLSEKVVIPARTALCVSAPVTLSEIVLIMPAITDRLSDEFTLSEKVSTYEAFGDFWIAPMVG